MKEIFCNIMFLICVLIFTGGIIYNAAYAVIQIIRRYKK